VSFFVFFLLIFLWGSHLQRKTLRHRDRACERGIKRLQRPPEVTVEANKPLDSSQLVRDRFGDGVYLIGIDISPGLYRAPGVPGTDLCWARLRTVIGGETDVIAGYQGNGPGIVEILSHDFAFWSQNSGGWEMMFQTIELPREADDG
jgi:hypothetical protein